MTHRTRGNRSPLSIRLARDTEATAFTVLLTELIQRIPGAHSAALVDRDGESVDYAGVLSPFDVKVAGAHWQIVLADIRRSASLQRTRQILVRGQRRSFLLRSLADGYAVVVVLSARAGFSSSVRAFSVFERGLLAEAGIGTKPDGPVWTPVVVVEDERARPRSLATSRGVAAQAVEVLGAVMGLGRGERGFRIRMAGGFETTVVREPGGLWYADEPLAHERAANSP